MEQTLPISLLEPAAKAEAGTRTKPEPLRVPLFIQDAVTPFGGATLLLALCRHQAAERGGS